MDQKRWKQWYQGSHLKMLGATGGFIPTAIYLLLYLAQISSIRRIQRYICMSFVYLRERSLLTPIQGIGIYILQ